MNNQDIRWQQRFANYKKALLQLQNAVVLSEQRALSPLEKQGVSVFAVMEPIHFRRNGASVLSA